MPGTNGGQTTQTGNKQYENISKYINPSDVLKHSFDWHLFATSDFTTQRFWRQILY